MLRSDREENLTTQEYKETITFRKNLLAWGGDEVDRAVHTDREATRRNISSERNATEWS